MGQISSTTYDSFGRTLTTTDADGQVTLYVYGNSSLAPAAFASLPGSANELYGKYYFATAADVTGGAGVSPGSVGQAKSITDTLITPANGDPRSPYTNTTTFQYDSNGNLTCKSGPSGIIHYVYDSATQRHTETWTGTSYADAATDIMYGYNSMGELASVTVLKENGTVPAAVRSSTQYPGAPGQAGTTNLPNTVYQYDLGGRLESTFDSATGITTNYAYKPNTNCISQAIGGAPLTMTGHSLGGGLAAAAAIATGRPAVTFNAAGLNPETVISENGQFFSSSVINYSVEGELLTGIQNLTLAPEAYGLQYEIAPAAQDAGWSPLQLHSMLAVLSALGMPS